MWREWLLYLWHFWPLQNSSWHSFLIKKSPQFQNVNRGICYQGLNWSFLWINYGFFLIQKEGQYTCLRGQEFLGYWRYLTVILHGYYNIGPKIYPNFLLRCQITISVQPPNPYCNMGSTNDIINNWDCLAPLVL